MDDTTNETNAMWRDWREQVVKPMRARRIRQAERDAAELKVTVRILEPVSHHWRCTTPAGRTFDYWPTTRTVAIGGTYTRATPFRDAVALADRQP